MDEQYFTSWQLVFYLLILASYSVVFVEGDDCPRRKCNDGSCPRSLHEMCLEDDCGYRRRRCGNTMLCVIEGNSCPGEPCTRNEKTCANGKCIPIYENDCPDGSMACGWSDKRCESGRCINKSYRCNEDPCPDSLPYKCGTQCRSMHVICDGVEDCDSGEDEIGCDEGTSKLWYLMILLIIPLACCGCCCYYCYKGWQEADEEEKANQEGVAMTSISQLPNSTTQAPQVAQTVVITNPVTGNVTYEQSDTPEAPVEPLLPAVSPIIFDNHPTPTAPSSNTFKDQPPSAPPGYDDVMNNQQIYPPPGEKVGFL